VSEDVRADISADVTVNRRCRISYVPLYSYCILGLWAGGCMERINGIDRVSVGRHNWRHDWHRHLDTGHQ